MRIRRLPPDEDAIERWLREAWLPYHRGLETAVEAHALADDLDLDREASEFWLDRLEGETARAWVAVDGETDGESDTALSETDGDLVGFITTSVEEISPAFDRPNRLLVGDFYVSEPYRGSGLADALLERAAERARNLGCSKVELDVDVDNERALAYYQKVGFEPRRYRMSVDVEEL